MHVGDFGQLFEALIDCLEAITTEKEWHAKTQTEASGLLSQITSSSFLCAVNSVNYLFGFTNSLSVLLQGSTNDIVTAYEKIQLILQEMKAIRSNAEVEFQNVFETATEMAEKAGQNITMPRCCKKQTMRSNVEADTPQTYYRRTIFVPFLENMVQQMADRFPQLTLHATRGLFLIPKS